MFSIFSEKVFLRYFLYSSLPTVRPEAIWLANAWNFETLYWTDSPASASPNLEEAYLSGSKSDI